MPNSAIEKWIKPGSSNPGIHATTNIGDSDLFYVFSTNAYPFEAGKAYDKFAAYTLLNHGGDYSKAASALSKQGYGDRPKPAPKANSQPEASASNQPLDDIGNAFRFVEQHGSTVKWVQERGKFFCWNGSIWEEDTTQQVLSKAHKTVRRIFEEAQQCQIC